MSDLDCTRISVYPVGVLAALQRSRRMRSLRPLHQEVVYLKRQVGRKKWRAVRNAFNGYLAEIDYPPEGLRFMRCGRGWTKRAALSSLGRRLGEDNR